MAHMKTSHLYLQAGRWRKRESDNIPNRRQVRGENISSTWEVCTSL